MPQAAVGYIDQPLTPDQSAALATRSRATPPAPSADAGGAPPAAGPAMTFARVNGQDVPIAAGTAAQASARSGFVDAPLPKTSTGAIDYDELARQHRATAQPDTAGGFDVGELVGDLVKGALKSLARTGIAGGALLRRVPGVNALDELVPPITVPVEPTNAAQRVGGVLEQLAEVAAPARAVTAAGVKTAEVLAPTLSRVVGETGARILPRAAVEAAGNAALAKAQGASNVGAGVTAALSAALPTTGQLAVLAARRLRTGAATDVARFFGPTTRPMKDVIEKRLPEILERGGEVLGATGRGREAAADVFGTKRAQLGEAIDEALGQFGSDVVADAPQRLIAALDQAKAPYVTVRTMPADRAVGGFKRFVVNTQDGIARLEIPRDVAKVRQIEGLKRIVAAHGDDMSVADLVGIRRAWDEIAYARPGTTLQTVKGQAEKWAKKMGGDAIRAVLNSDAPELQALNREYSFWKDLETVVDATNARTRPQVGGVLGPMAQGAGRVVGAAAGAGHGVTGAVGGAVLAGQLAKTAQKIFASPRYASLSASWKNGLADALESGSRKRVASWLGLTALKLGVIEGPRLAGAAAQ